MRRSGKTTRMVDDMVQHLFKSGRVVIPIIGLEKDWTRFGDDVFGDADAHSDNMAQRCMADVFHTRLRIEHEGTFNFKKEPDYLIYTRKD